MTAEQAKALHEQLPGTELIETHISWVLLGETSAWKIKKTLRFDFLDYSSLEKRHFYCNEEVSLNRRLAPEVYLEVLPIGFKDGKWTLNAEPALDYAVHMRRIDNAFQMDHLLEKGQVNKSQMGDLARILANFHLKNRMHGAILYNPSLLWADFSALYQHRGAMEKYLDKAVCQTIFSAQQQLEHWLETHEPVFQHRARMGYWVEGHGDLHSRNIFLCNPPVVFDCIEFSAHFREMDVLNELAFLLMDLDSYGQLDLSAHFLSAYTSIWNPFADAAHGSILTFFKAYRANVRLKIGLLELGQHPSAGLLKRVKTYAQLLKNYLEDLPGLSFL